MGQLIGAGSMGSSDESFIIVHEHFLPGARKASSAAMNVTFSLSSIYEIP